MLDAAYGRPRERSRGCSSTYCEVLVHNLTPLEITVIEVNNATWLFSVNVRLSGAAARGAIDLRAEVDHLLLV